MLTQREKDFIRYWEANRLRRKKVVRQFLIGIPIGLLFVIPIVINFSSGWYRRADMEANSSDFNPVVLLVALLLIVGFTAIFYQRHQWDQYEQHYRELLARQEKEGPSPGSDHPPTFPDDTATPK
jgi:membrane protein YdbS with pleckstrin-like domain